MQALMANECSHCFNLRRDARVRLEGVVTDPAEIERQLKRVLCREHTYLDEERRRKERRKAGR